MDLKVADWIEHATYGHGQIVGDCESSWLIRFVDHDEKRILKGFVKSEGHPPYPGFAFPNVALRPKAGAKPRNVSTSTPDFDHLLERFLSKYPGGLGAAEFSTDERKYKEEAAMKFSVRLSRTELANLLESASYDEVAKRSAQLISATNLTFRFENIKFNNALKAEQNQKIFAEALYGVLYGTDANETRFDLFVRELGRMDINSWPLATYFQFLETKGRLMFMKPTVAKRMADAVGIALNYRPEPNSLTYSKLQEIAREIRGRLLSAGQILQSEMDVQSFMWCAYGIAKE